MNESDPMKESDPRMWLLPLFSVIARLAARVYYRIRFGGAPVPATGPVLLVANHPNSLLDPTLVVASAGRPVRFMAKAPLFSDRKIGWLVRAAGAIPVYRRTDDPTQMARNEDAFRAVFEALRSGSAVGIFPEGISHSEPSMAPLKTGAARIALGAASLIGRAFPIVPVGLTFRSKDTFRSEALAVRGAPVRWEDLSQRGTEDADAVRELTARIDASLRAITINLSSWEDRPLVECAVQIWEAERDEPSREGERLARLEYTTKVLADIRVQQDASGSSLVADVERHDSRLTRLGLRPGDLYADVGAARGVKWAVRRIHLLLPLGIVLAVVGAALFWVPYQLTGMIVGRMRLPEDVRSTWKLLIGIVLYVLWLLALVAVAATTFGWLAAFLTLILVPVVAIAGLTVRENWRDAWDDARRFFLIRSRGSLIEKLRAEQKRLAGRLDTLISQQQ
jgi:glycerol-3-phosphate O-acyltransferase/dihydroxyacetone phosphate acyltransferase